MDYDVLWIYQHFFFPPEATEANKKTAEYIMETPQRKNKLYWEKQLLLKTHVG